MASCNGKVQLGTLTRKIRVPDTSFWSRAQKPLLVPSSKTSFVDKEIQLNVEFDECNKIITAVGGGIFLKQDAKDDKLIIVDTLPEYRDSNGNIYTETEKSLTSDNLKTSLINSRSAYIDRLPEAEIASRNLTDLKYNKGNEETVNNPEDINLLPLTDEERKYLNENGVMAGGPDIPFPRRNLFYPLTLKSNEEFHQDYIKFQIIDYKTRVFTVEGVKRYERYVIKEGKNFISMKDKLIKCEIWLPIQGGIADSNNVVWNNEPLDAIQQALSFVSLSVQGGEDKSKSGKIIDSLSKLASDSNTSTAITSYLQALLARMAINSQSNFFSRAFGSILNPNLELLFNSPDLRPFSFRFDLTPRDKEEAILVKQIIRTFKQSMAPRKGIADIFLKTPMVYDISYINGKTGKDHTSIGRVKTCALKSFNVNYTPANQYMTYDDPENTMTAYSLEMQLNELEPVFYDDFKDVGNSEIGY